jgi:hypothetical protein
MNHDEFYCFKTKLGTDRIVRKIPEIEKMTSNIKEMSDIGKLTHLLWGYNIVNPEGVIMRKFKFLSTYPVLAKRIINIIYPPFYRLRNPITEQAFRKGELNDKIFGLIGFTIIRTADLR